MHKNILYQYLLPAFIVVAIGVVAWWLIYNPVKTFTTSQPGMDERKTGAVALQKVNIGESFTFFKTCEDIPGTRWPRFRGADFDNINKENTRLIDNWGKAGPKILWKKQLGEGHAAPAVYDGRVYILDYDETSKQDLLRCFSWQTAMNSGNADTTSGLNAITAFHALSRLLTINMW